MGRRWHPASRGPPAVAAAVDGRTVAAGGFEVGWHCPRLRTIAVAAVSGIVAVDRERGETELETIVENSLRQFEKNGISVNFVWNHICSRLARKVSFRHLSNFSRRDRLSLSALKDKTNKKDWLFLVQCGTQVNFCCCCC